MSTVHHAMHQRRCSFPCSLVFPKVSVMSPRRHAAHHASSPGASSHMRTSGLTLADRDVCIAVSSWRVAMTLTVIHVFSLSSIPRSFSFPFSVLCVSPFAFSGRGSLSMIEYSSTTGGVLPQYIHTLYIRPRGGRINL